MTWVKLTESDLREMLSRNNNIKKIDIQSKECLQITDLEMACLQPTELEAAHYTACGASCNVRAQSIMNPDQ